MRAHDLAHLLLRAPNGEVATYDGMCRHEIDIEQVILVRVNGKPVVVLGLDIDAPEYVDGCEVLWTKDDLAERCLEAAQNVANQSKREAV